MTDHLTLEIVVEQASRRGFVLRDPGWLDAALHRPQATVFGQDAYPTLAHQAAALMHSIAQGQAFMDGNRRMALLTADAFVRINGHRIGAQHQDVFELLASGVPAGLSDIAVIADRLRVQPV